MTAERHADFEALSAYVDGEAPEWADHVAGCPACRAAADEIRSVVSAVATPVDRRPPADRDAAIAAAMGAFSTGPEAPAGDDRPRPRLAPERPAPTRRWGSRPWAMPAVAAAIVAVLGFSGLVVTSHRSSRNSAETVAGGTFAGDAKAGGAAGVAAAAPTVPPADLGDIPDAATLRSRAQLGAGGGAGVTGTSGDAAATGRSSSSSNSGAPSDASAVTGQASTASPASNSGNTGTPATASGSGPVPAVAPLGAPAGASGLSSTQGPGGAATNVVGTRPCEERARARDASLGPVVYFATARQGTVPAYVLGFSPPPGKAVPGLTLLLLSQDGCAELLRAAGP
jgi:hypothetical protein